VLSPVAFATTAGIKTNKDILSTTSATGFPCKARKKKYSYVFCRRHKTSFLIICLFFIFTTFCCRVYLLNVKMTCPLAPICLASWNEIDDSSLLIASLSRSVLGSLPLNALRRKRQQVFKKKREGWKRRKEERS
jgi:hypothetical protein